MKVYHVNEHNAQDGGDTVECDHFKYDVHPVTGKFTLTFYRTVGQVHQVLGAAAAVVHFQALHT